MTAFVLKAISASFTALTMPAGFQGLANNGISVATSTNYIDNTSSGGDTKRYRIIYIELQLATLNPTGSPIIDIALIPSFNGTNFHSLAGSLFPIASNMAPIAWASLDTGSAAKRVYFAFKNVDPVFYYPMVRNGTGVAFNGAGNVLGWQGSMPETR
jgi:hypothetical protein